MSQDKVTLRTGEEVLQVTVEAVLMSIEALYRNTDHPMALFELVLVCRDGTHIPFGNSKEVLKSFGLVESIDASGRVEVHNDIRRIVLAATEGEGNEVRLVSPYLTDKS